MSVGTQVQITGFRDTVKALRQLDRKARRRVASKAARAGGKEILKTARAAAPHDTGQLRKQLRQSVKFDRRRGSITATIQPKRTKAQRRRGQKQRRSVIHLVVSGTQSHYIDGPVVLKSGIFSAVDHPGARANPFMDRAANKSFSPAHSAFRKAFAQHMDTEIRKARAT